MGVPARAGRGRTGPAQQVRERLDLRLPLLVVPTYLFLFTQPARRMLPLPYSQNKALGTLSGFLNTIQNRLQPVPRTRLVRKRNGKVLDTPIQETYLVTPKACSDGCQATMRLLVTMQLRAVEEARRVSFLQEPAIDAAPTPPPITTNNEELARLRRVSSRAIRDHIREAIGLGIIAVKNFRGTQANFELWISTKFLWKTDSQAVKLESAENRTKDAPAALDFAEATNFPLIEVLEKQYKKDIDSSSVDLLASSPQQTTLTGNTGPQQPQATDPKPAKQPRQAKQATKDRAKVGGAKVLSDAENELLQAKRRDMAREFFDLSWKLRSTLWPGKDFNDHEIGLWKKAVWNGVYRGFESTLTETQWAQYHKQNLKQLGMVAKYLLRRPTSWIVAPYAEYIAGSGYFDAENLKGFAGTVDWYARKEAANLQMSLTRDLNTAKKQLNAHRLGLATKRNQAKTRIQLYRLLENRLRAKYGPAGLKLFHELITPPTTVIS